MIYTVTTDSLDDAEDLFIVAKDRLLDVNDWHTTNSFTLTDSHKHKLHRNAHRGDYITNTVSNEEWYVINKIQYDDYPDISGESLTISIQNVNATEHSHVIKINRIGKKVSVEGDDLAFTGNEENFLKGFIMTAEYAVAS